jgi:hypothetical protein
MAYYIDLFSPETYEAFRAPSRDVSGFRPRQKSIAQRVSVGDIFVCYMTRLSRWFGLLEVIDGPFIDNTPIFVFKDDPFTVRFRVNPLVILEPEKSIPIHDSQIWNGLSFTRHLPPGSLGWTGKVRSSLVHLEDEDGRFLMDRIKAQAAGGKGHPLDEDDERKLVTHTVTRPDKVVAVSVPEDSALTEETEAPPANEVRESIRIQALIATIGTQMGLSIWLPKADRGPLPRSWAPSRRDLWKDCP